MSVIRQAAKGVFSLADAFFDAPAGPRILIYHRVGADTGLQLDVSIEDFQWQLDWLSENREVVDLESAIRRWEEPGSDQMVVISIDDGYPDTFTTAFPMLSNREMPFTLYVATEAVGREPGTGQLSWGEIDLMRASGLMTVGVHTHTHRDLRSASPEDVRYELQTSDSLVEQHLGIKPVHFTYPWGYWSAVAHREVVARYETATVGAMTKTASFNRHMIHRFPVQAADGRRWFPARLRGGLILEERVRRALRSYEGP